MINHKKLLSYSLSSILACSLLSGVGFASHKKKKATSATQTTTTNQTPATTVSAGDIANAKSKGMVWVNTESKVYHTDGRYYGNTKHGQFMSIADAQKSGYKAAKR
jgi:hypothetical protein